MKKDIHFPKVSDVGFAVVNNATEERWDVFLLNMKEVPLENVLVATKGYGVKKGKDVKTSTLRHYFEQVPAKSFQFVEPIMENLFGLTNEYWLSFYLGRTVFDKKFIFLPESIQENNFTTIPLMKQPGILIL